MCLLFNNSYKITETLFSDDDRRCKAVKNIVGVGTLSDVKELLIFRIEPHDNIFRYIFI